MSYLGQVELKSSEIRRIDVTSSTSATHTLTWTPPSEQSLIITINGIKQQNNYSISGTTLTLDTALTATDEMEVVGILDIGDAVTPPDDSITNAMVKSDAAIAQSKLATLVIDTTELADDAVTADKLANSINTEIAANTAKVTNATHTGDVTGATALTIAADAVDIAMLSATGTADATTFLRGDNSWVVPGGGKLLQMVVDSYTSEQSTTSHTMGTMPNLSTSITLSDSANTVLVWVALNGIVRDSDGGASSEATGAVFELFRDTTKVADLGGYVSWFEPTSGTQLGIGSFGCSFPDTPGDTSAHAYTLKWARSRDDGAAYIYMNRGGSTYSSIICLEIAA